MALVLKLLPSFLDLNATLPNRVVPVALTEGEGAKRAHSPDAPDESRSGGVVFIRPSGSALNVHFHSDACQIDGLNGQLRESIGSRQFDRAPVRYFLYQHHTCQIPQPLLLKQLRKCGIDLSAVQFNELLLTGKDGIYTAQSAPLSTGPSVSSYGAVNDTDPGFRHQGRNGYLARIGRFHCLVQEYGIRVSGQRI